MQTKLDSALAWRLRNESAAGKLALAGEHFGSLRGAFHAESADILAQELFRAFAGEARAQLESWLAEVPESPNSAYLRARFASDGGAAGAADAAARWERFFALHQGRDPMHLLAYARALGDCERWDQAAAALRRALEQPLRYTFFPRAEKLLANVSRRAGGALRTCRIAILGTHTTSLLLPVLKAYLLRDRVDGEIYEGLYGSVEQEALDQTSGLAKFRPDLVFLITNWRALNLPAAAGDAAPALDAIIDGRKTLWERLSRQFGCHVVQQAFDFPAEEAYEYLAAALPGGRSRTLAAINARMLEEAPAYVSILDTPALEREQGLDRWQDDMLWHSFQQHPSTEALPALADAMAAHVRAVTGLTRKALVTDLDNTLWKGVIGEDGLNGIQVGSGSPAGEAHRRLQQYLLDLKSRGVLLAVASKNNLEDARLPFEKHPGMLLKLDDFAAFEANWNDKAASIRAIAAKLSLGLDSFVFIDDNPLEREWVRSQIPEVATVELGASVYRYARDLDRGRYFFSLRLSQEDQSRAEQYRGEARREQLRASAQSLDEFLAQLQLRAWAEPVTAVNLARVAQLTNKTNQFNLTTRRYTEEQVRQLASDPAGWAGAFHLSDRMGDYGLIGVVFCRPGASAAQWEIDTWLMSCRVLGRQMEKFMFDRVMEAARARGVRQIVGVYRPTAKNGLVAGHYDHLGFGRMESTAAETRYALAVPAEAAALATHIRNESEAAALAV